MSSEPCSRPSLGFQITVSAAMVVSSHSQLTEEKPPQNAREMNPIHMIYAETSLVASKICFMQRFVSTHPQSCVAGRSDGHRSLGPILIEDLCRMRGGMLCFDPEYRLTLGEMVWSGGARG